MSKTGMPDGLKTVITWVIGLGIIALIGLVMVILFGNLSGNVGFGRVSVNVVNVTLTLGTSVDITDLNEKVNPVFTNVIVYNATAPAIANGLLVPSSNYTVTGGQIAETISDFTTINLSGTMTYDSRGKVDTDRIIGNYTKAVTQTASHFPTVGVILGVSILLVILIGLMIFAITKLMKVASAGSSGGNSSSNFMGNSNSDFA